MSAISLCMGCCQVVCLTEHLWPRLGAWLSPLGVTINWLTVVRSTMMGLRHRNAFRISGRLNPHLKTWKCSWSGALMFCVAVDSLNKLMKKRSSCRWFETIIRRNCNDYRNHIPVVQNIYASVHKTMDWKMGFLLHPSPPTKKPIYYLNDKRFT